eukprot:1187108-Prorocentrum_minimum.AAC.1
MKSQLKGAGGGSSVYRGTHSLRGVECTLAVIGTGGPVTRSCIRGVHPWPGGGHSGPQRGEQCGASMWTVRAIMWMVRAIGRQARSVLGRGVRGCGTGWGLR